MSYSMILLGILVIIILYILYTYVYMSSTVANDTTDLNVGTGGTRPEKDMTKMTTPNSKEYYYSMWIYIDNNYPYDVNNVIINRSNYWCLVLRGSKLSLYNGGTISADGTYNTTGDSTAKMPNTGNEAIVFTDNFPFQKWVHVVFSVSGNTIDGYLDGKLVKTVSGSASSLGTDTTTKLTIGNKNILGKITQINYYPMAIDPQTVWQLYTYGNGIYGWAKYFQKYNVQMEITKNSDKYYNFSLL